MARALDKRLNIRMSPELMAVIDQHARQLGLSQSEWVRQAIVSYAVMCRALDLADEHPDEDLRDPATLARLLLG